MTFLVIFYIYNFKNAISGKIKNSYSYSQFSHLLWVLILNGEFIWTKT